MSIFPGFGEQFGKEFKSNPETVAHTNALNLRNEQFALGQTQRAERVAKNDTRRAEDVAFRDAQVLSQRQRSANETQSKNVGFSTIEQPVATSPDAPSGVKQSTTSHSARRSGRNVRRGR